jgi:hypothetical protein
MPVVRWIVSLVSVALLERNLYVTPHAATMVLKGDLCVMPHASTTLMERKLWVVPHASTTMLEGDLLVVPHASTTMLNPVTRCSRRVSAPLSGCNVTQGWEASGVRCFGDWIGAVGHRKGALRVKCHLGPRLWECGVTFICHKEGRLRGRMGIIEDKRGCESRL